MYLQREPRNVNRGKAKGGAGIGLGRVLQDRIETLRHTQHSVQTIMFPQICKCVYKCDRECAFCVCVRGDILKCLSGPHLLCENFCSFMRNSLKKLTRRYGEIIIATFQMRTLCLSAEHIICCIKYTPRSNFK